MYYSSGKFVKFVWISQCVSSYFNLTTYLQLLTEYKRYMTLIQRPKILNDLRSNRENLLVQVINLVEQYQEAIRERQYGQEKSCGYSQIVRKIYCLKQMDYTVCIL